MAVNDIYQLTVRGTLFSQTILNVLYYRESVSAGSTGQAALATAADSTLGAAWRTALSQDFTYNDVTAQKIFPLPVMYPTTVGTGTGIGSVASGAQPSEVAVVITKRTAFAGRKYRGRAFIAGATISQVTGDILTGPGVTAMGGIATAIASALTSGGYTFTPIVYHKPTHSYDDVAGGTVHATLRAQRRRQPGRGQ